MNRTFKNLLEITQIEAAQGRIDELDRFLDVTRSFSLRCSGHLRMITNLINNLVESEDWLELGDTDLRLPERRRGGLPSLRLDSHEENETVAVLGGLRSENEKLMRLIEKGEDNTAYLRGIMARLLDELSQKNLRSEIARESHRECHSQCYDAPGATLSNSNLRSNDEDQRLVLVCAELAAANKRLQAEIEQLRQQGSADGEALGEMLKKMMEVKADCDKKLQEKDRELEDVLATLAQAEQFQAQLHGELDVFRAQQPKPSAAQHFAPASHDRVVLDFLKACYNQASYIEEFIMVSQ